MYEGIPIQRGIRRIDLGGKHLTNLLKEIISVRYYDLHQDAKIVNDIKEDVCFVSLNMHNDMDLSWKGDLSRRRKKGMKLPISEPIFGRDEDSMDLDEQIPRASTLTSQSDSDPLVDYILPDGFKIRRGFSRPHKAPSSDQNKKGASVVNRLSADETEDEVSMTLGSERFCIPEILFTPSDVSSRQPGIAEAIMQSLAVLPPALQVALLANILVVGGNARMRGFAERLRNEIRMLAPVEYEVRVAVMRDPVMSTWLGGARMAGNRESVRKIGVTKEEYAEYGSAWVGRKFAGASK
jgi:actin-related protein 6